MKFHATILTSFPAMFPGPLEFSIAGSALKKKLWSLDVIDIRDFGLTKHKSIDDEAYGGSQGMVMRADVLGCALDYAIKKSGSKKIYYMSPRGKLLKQQDVIDIKNEENIIILCGRYEGIDERVIVEYNLEEISIGDYILSGGELASLVLLDSCIRLIPGVLPNAENIINESFGEEGLLECPLYTRPKEWLGHLVPKILLSGHHEEINSWRMKQAEEITKIRRPDLWNIYNIKNTRGR